MSIPKRKAIGQRGSWFAEVDEESLPCVHDFWVKRTPEGLFYIDPNYEQDIPKWRQFIDAIQEKKRVILTNDTVIDGGLGSERKGYIAVFGIEDIVIEGQTLKFRFVERLIDLD